MTALPLKVVVGLGNPGAEHEATRHNAGFWFVDELARRHGGRFKPERRYGAALELAVSANEEQGDPRALLDAIKAVGDFEEPGLA